MLKRSLQVMVTRPLPAGDVLCQQVIAAGGRAIFFPTLAFLPSADPTPLAAKLALLDQYDGWIFTSPQAVYASQSVLHEIVRRLQKTMAIVAVGAGTAAALQAAAVPVTAQPAETAWNSEGVLDLPALQQLTDQKIAIVTGDGGRSLLRATLQARGAHVDTIRVYRRVCPVIAVEPTVALLRAQAIDVVVCTSGEGLQNLASLLSSAWPELQKVVLIVISERMRVLAVTLGFTKIFLAKNASHSAIMESLEQIAAGQP